MKNYINCLVQLKNYDIALYELKKYKGISPDSKIWKTFSIAEIYLYKEDLIKLKEFYLKSLDMYDKYRYSDISSHSIYFYMIGLFSKKLSLHSDSAFYFKNAVLSYNGTILDKIYKEKAENELKLMGM